MKGHTTIPFARETAELIEYPEIFKPDFKKRDMTFWARTMHFENRYRSIDQLLSELPVKNILEISSGFSFRGLEITKQDGFYYIDSDLPDVIGLKRKFITALSNGKIITKGSLELLALNALDEEKFNEIVNHFPAGEIVIINEGLLMYLDTAEKEKLCEIIHKILMKRGGYWITADIYIRHANEKVDLKFDDKTKEFFDQHNLEENKFESFEAAESFFSRMGFKIDGEARVNHSRLSSMKYFLKSLSPGQLFKLRKAGKMQTTWRLQTC
jgi:O-methyltransferase involved in polyketide biosynthesis